MGRRDYRHRETKKTKKDTKRLSTDTFLTPPATVEVIKKGKREPSAGE